MKYIKMWINSSITPLKNCPNCGSYKLNFISRTQAPAARVECKDCKLKTGFYKTDEEASIAWNRMVVLKGNKI